MTTTAMNREVDLLILGGGAGGLAAALAGALMGLKVMVCEKTDQVGGTASTSAGTLWIPENTQSVKQGYADTRRAAQDYLAQLIHDPASDPLREAFLQTGPEAIDFFQNNSAVQFLACGKHPDYLDLPGAAVVGRAIVPAPFDGRLLKREFRRVRPPIPEFMVLGGMMVGKLDIDPLVGRWKNLSNFRHAAKLALRYARDRLRYPRGTRLVMGNALIARLYYSLLQAGGEVLFETVATELQQRDGRVCGARLKSANGDEIRIDARRGVVLATGGYAHDKGLRDVCMPRPVPEISMACASNSGDGIRLGQALHADLDPSRHGSGAFWTPVSRVPGARKHGGLFPHLALDRAKPGLIAVDGNGRRFVNEAVSYHHFVEAMLMNETISATRPAYLICNAAFVRQYGLGAIYPGTRNLRPFEANGYLRVADSIRALARAIGVPETTLEATLVRYNEDAQRGVDTEFGKGTTELNRFNGDPSHVPNPCVAPITEGPYCAVAVWPAEIACSTGLETDVDGVVRRADGTPIDGLYACGNDMASIMRGTYPGPGTTLGPALVFAYRIARHASGPAPQ